MPVAYLVGTSGAGKSTAAAEAARRTPGLRVFDADEVMGRAADRLCPLVDFRKKWDFRLFEDLAKYADAAGVIRSEWAATFAAIESRPTAIVCEGYVFACSALWRDATATALEAAFGPLKQRYFGLIPPSEQVARNVNGDNASGRKARWTYDDADLAAMVDGFARIVRDHRDPAFECFTTRDACIDALTQLSG